MFEIAKPLNYTYQLEALLVSAVDFISIQSHTLEDGGHRICYVLVDKENDKPEATKHSPLGQWFNHTGTGGSRG